MGSKGLAEGGDEGTKGRERKAHYVGRPGGGILEFELEQDTVSQLGRMFELGTVSQLGRMFDLRGYCQGEGMADPFWGSGGNPPALPSEERSAGTRPLAEVEGR